MPKTLLFSQPVSVSFYCLALTSQQLQTFLSLSLPAVFSHASELGTERTFSLVNDVHLYELKLSSSQAIGYRTSGELRLSIVYGDNDNGFLLRFEVSEERGSVVMTIMSGNRDYLLVMFAADQSLFAQFLIIMILAEITATVCRKVQSPADGL
jgi:hypothetical protein